MAEQPKVSAATLEQVLKLRTQLELIFDVDLIRESIDVRKATVLDISAERIIITQADPPILKSMIGRSPEATFVRRDPVTGDVIRWGWQAQIKEIIENYKSQPDDAQAVTALAIACPSEGGLTQANARMDYRISVTDDRKVSIQTHPSFGRVRLLDFSACGVLIAIPRPPQAKVGTRLWFTLFFPVLSTAGQQTVINGEAEVRWFSLDEDEQAARVGLKFLDLDLSSTRALQKAINHYMLEEQRARGRSSAPGGGQASEDGQDPA
jgi:hypothetical protein